MQCHISSIAAESNPSNHCYIPLTGQLDWKLGETTNSVKVICTGMFRQGERSEDGWLTIELYFTLVSQNLVVVVRYSSAGW